MASPITLIRSKIRERGDSLIITHIATGVEVEVSKDKLDRWCIAHLRALISSPPVQAITEPRRRSTDHY